MAAKGKEEASVSRNHNLPLGIWRLLRLHTFEALSTASIGCKLKQKEHVSSPNPFDAEKAPGRKLIYFSPSQGLPCSSTPLSKRYP